MTPQTIAQTLTALLMREDARDFLITTSDGDTIRVVHGNHDAYHTIVTALDTEQAIVVEARDLADRASPLLESLALDPAVTSGAFIREHVVVDARWRKRFENNPFGLPPPPGGRTP